MPKGSARLWGTSSKSAVCEAARNVVLVQVTNSLATLVPISPGGIGTEQAFLVYVFRGKVWGFGLTLPDASPCL